jgi:hypothetical protein
VRGFVARWIIVLALLNSAFLLAQGPGPASEPFDTYYAWAPDYRVGNRQLGTSGTHGRAFESFWHLNIYRNSEKKNAIGLFFSPLLRDRTRLVTGIEFEKSTDANGPVTFSRSGEDGYAFSVTDADSRHPGLGNAPHYRWGNEIQKKEKLDGLTHFERLQNAHTEFPPQKYEMNAAGLLDVVAFGRPSFSFTLEEDVYILGFKTSEENILLVVMDPRLTYGSSSAPAVFPLVKLKQTGSRYVVEARLAFASMGNLINANALALGIPKDREGLIPKPLSIRFEFGGDLYPQLWARRETSSEQSLIQVDRDLGACGTQILESSAVWKTP